MFILFFITHWYLSLFFQTFFHHRYASHGAFTMSKSWERVFYILSFITQGSS
ncbi:MAG TPA: acyl-CoA desaturase, partial [Ignavibacteria bacterium]|nr:acyl-CoA desaturase [Ignavibacteria bacterium]